MINGRIIIPLDVFTTLCVETKKLSDCLLAAATTLQHEVAFLPENTKTLDHLLASHTQLGLIEGLLSAILGQGKDDPTPEGGNDAHVQ